MEQMLINPVVTGLPGVPAIGRGMASAREPGGGFQQFLEQRLNQARQAQNALGAGGKVEKTLPEEVTENYADPKGQEGDEKSLLAAWLVRVMATLQDLAGETPKAGAGSWTVPESALAELQTLAAAAGMSEADFSLLAQRMTDDGGMMHLDEFFGFLARHFEQLAAPQPVTVPETDLPFLQSILAQLGVPPTEMSAVSEAAVTGDDRLDLAVFLEGISTLKPVETVSEITLTDWEAEQFSEILASAGVSKPVRAELLAGLQKLEPGKQQPSFTLSLPKLADVLSRGLQDIQNQRAAASLPDFVAGLNDLLQEAGLTGGNRQWTPLLAGSREGIHKELQKIVDLSTVRVEKKVDKVVTPRENQTLASHIAEQDEKNMQWGVANEKALGDGGNGQESEKGDSNAPVLLAPAGTEDFGPIKAPAAVLHGVAAGMAGQAAGQADSPQSVVVPRHELPGQPQQAVIDQLSRGLMRGLENREHHLILRLNPPELGEVKIDMVVRDDHVSVSFAMENGRVKEAIESSMQQFSDSLAERGFVLDQFSANVGQQDDARDAWQETVRHLTKNGPAALKRADLSDTVLYSRPAGPLAAGSGISLFV